MQFPRKNKSISGVPPHSNGCPLPTKMYLEELLSTLDPKKKQDRTADQYPIGFGAEEFVLPPAQGNMMENYCA